MSNDVSEYETLVTVVHLAQNAKYKTEVTTSPSPPLDNCVCHFS